MRLLVLDPEERSSFETGYINFALLLYLATSKLKHTKQKICLVHSLTKQSL